MVTSLRQALIQETPLQIVGVIHALAARLAEQAGFKALYLSGAGVANSRLALPDLGMTSLNDVLEEVTKITQATDLPLLVDADTGWGSPLNVRRSFKALERAGAMGAHIEDQQDDKRCGHLEGKRLVSTQEMVSKLKAALDARINSEFMVIARTDALAVEGFDKALERAKTYERVGADAIFVEAVKTLEEYEKFSKALQVPILANITEFGKTPLFTVEQLSKSGVKLILYPLSAFRAMNEAALKVYTAIRIDGTQQSVIPLMQSREALYKVLNYQIYENELEKYLTDVEKKS